MSENPIIIFHGWSDQAASFDRLAGMLREKIRDRCCKYLTEIRKVLGAKQKILSYGQKLKQRRVGDSAHREFTPTKTEVLKAFIPNQTLLIEIVLKRDRMDLVLVRYGE